MPTFALRHNVVCFQISHFIKKRIWFEFAQLCFFNASFSISRVSVYDVWEWVDAAQTQILQRLVFRRMRVSTRSRAFSSHGRFLFVGIFFRFLLIFLSISGDFQPRVYNSWHPPRDAVFQPSRKQLVENACNCLSHALCTPRPPLQDSEEQWQSCRPQKGGVRRGEERIPTLLAQHPTWFNRHRLLLKEYYIL